MSDSVELEPSAFRENFPSLYTTAWRALRSNGDNPLGKLSFSPFDARLIQEPYPIVEPRLAPRLSASVRPKNRFRHLTHHDGSWRFQLRIPRQESRLTRRGFVVGKPNFAILAMPSRQNARHRADSSFSLPAAKATTGASSAARPP